MDMQLSVAQWAELTSVDTPVVTLLFRDGDNVVKQMVLAQLVALEPRLDVQLGIGDGCRLSGSGRLGSLRRLLDIALGTLSGLVERSNLLIGT